MYALDQGIAAEAVAPAAGLTVGQVLDVFRDIAGRRRTTRYQHEAPLLVDAPGS
jgi:NAD+ synthase